MFAFHTTFKKAKGKKSLFQINLTKNVVLVQEHWLTLFVITLNFKRCQGQ